MYYFNVRWPFSKWKVSHRTGGKKKCLSGELLENSWRWKEYIEKTNQVPIRVSFFYPPVTIYNTWYISGVQYCQSCQLATTSYVLGHRLLVPGTVRYLIVSDQQNTSSFTLLCPTGDEEAIQYPNAGCVFYPPTPIDILKAHGWCM